MRLRIKHTTRYRFSEPVTYGLQQLRKTPKSGHQQNVLDWSTTVENGRKEVTFEDNHNNVVELISIDRDATEVTVVSEGEVSVEDNGGVVGRHPGRRRSGSMSARPRSPNAVRAVAPSCARSTPRAISTNSTP